MQRSWIHFADAALRRAAAHADAGDTPDGRRKPVGVTGISVKDAEKQLTAAREQLHRDPDETDAFTTLVRNAGLPPDEIEALAICAAVEVSVARQRLVGWLQEDLNLTRPGLDLLSRLLGAPGTGALAVSHESALARSALIDVADTGPWGARAVSAPPSLVWALVGDPSSDPDLDIGVRFEDGPDPNGASVTFVTGPDRIQRRRVALEVTAGTRFVVTPMPTDTAGWRALVREATIRGAGIVLETDALSEEGRRWIERATHLPWSVSSQFELSVRTLPERPWSEHHVERREALPAEWDATVADAGRHRHRLTSEQLELVARVSANVDGDVEAAIRRLASGPIDQLARRVRPRYRWDDLVLDEDRTDQLRELVSRYRNSQIVYDDWGFPSVPSAGLIALFTGDPGTGKTMSAEVVAGELGLDLFVVDLAAIVSKYIGETEKNLEEVFAAASVGNQVLFFDEADSLFGKRSEVSDARDRYANLEVSYLLQRVEIYDGLIVMATNFANNIDSAFMRRIDVSIDFVPPEIPERTRLWERSFPASAPLADDVDPDELAAAFELSGGSIRKAALFAAFLAADAETQINRELIEAAVEREYRKLGRLRPGARRSKSR